MTPPTPVGPGAWAKSPRAHIALPCRPCMHSALTCWRARSQMSTCRRPGACRPQTCLHQIGQGTQARVSAQWRPAAEAGQRKHRRQRPWQRAGWLARHPHPRTSGCWWPSCSGQPAWLQVGAGAGAAGQACGLHAGRPSMGHGWYASAHTHGGRATTPHTAGAGPPPEPSLIQRMSHTTRPFSTRCFRSCRGDQHMQRRRGQWSCAGCWRHRGHDPAGQVSGVRWSPPDTEGMTQQGA